MCKLLILIAITFIKYILYCSGESTPAYTAETQFIELSCPDERRNAFPVSFTLMFNNGEQKEYASFTQTACTPVYDLVKCYNKVSVYTVVIGVSQRMRNMTGFYCFVGEIFSTIIFAKPQNNTCSEPVVNEVTKEISVACKTEKIFPKLACVFYIVQNGIPVDLLGTTVYSSKQISSDPIYYKGECSYYQPATTEWNKYTTLMVWMYPDITDGKQFGVKIEVQNNVKLTIPEVSLEGGCFGGSNFSSIYIKEGTTVTCVCKRNDSGTIGLIFWTDVNNNLIGVAGKNESVIVVGYPNDHAKTYVCKGNSFLGNQSKDVLFKPVFAYGPSIINFNTDNSKIFLCDEFTQKSKVVCSVDRQLAFPGVAFSYLVNGDVRIPFTASSSTSNVYSQTFEFISEVSGQFTITCVARNIIFNDLVGSKDVVINVIRPVKHVIIFEINNGQPIKEKNIAEMKCTTSEKTDLVRLLIECPSVIPLVQINGTALFNATRQMDGAVCTCKVFDENMCPNISVTYAKIIILGEESAKENQGFEIAAYVLASALGLIVISVIIITLVICIKSKRRKKPNMNRQSNEPINGVDQSENIETSNTIERRTTTTSETQLRRINTDPLPEEPSHNTNCIEGERPLESTSASRPGRLSETIPHETLTTELLSQPVLDSTGSRTTDDENPNESLPAPRHNICNHTTDYETLPKEPVTQTGDISLLEHTASKINNVPQQCSDSLGIQNSSSATYTYM